MNTIERILAALGATASISGILFYSNPNFSFFGVFKIPAAITVHTWFLILVVGLVLAILSFTLLFIGRSFEKKRHNNFEIERLNKLISELENDKIQLETQQNGLLNQLIKIEGKLVEDVEKRIPILLKTKHLQLKPLIIALGLDPSNKVHQQAVIEALGKFKEISSDKFSGYYWDKNKS